MPPYIRRLGEGFDALRALMKSALPLLYKAAASKTMLHDRVWGSRSDLWCHQLESYLHRAVGFFDLFILSVKPFSWKSA
jgi:hypothetical protein